VHGVVEAIRALAADPARARRGLAGQRLAARYDWDRVAAGFAGVVERAIAEARR
jgi:hypothetical protein